MSPFPERGDESRIYVNSIELAAPYGRPIRNDGTTRNDEVLYAVQLKYIYIYKQCQP